MDRVAAKILKALMGVENEQPLRPVPRTEHPNAAEYWTRAILMERGAYLGKLAKYGEGSASETIKEFPQHCAMLSFRSRDGDAEVHENFADIFYVLEGSATLVSGGAVTGARQISPGEMSGTSIIGGIRYPLGAGDVAHVPAGQPHQMLVSGEKGVTCLVVKVRETP